MFDFDDLYYLDERLIPGKTTRPEALAVLGNAADRVSYRPERKGFSSWIVNNPGLTVGTSPCYALKLQFGHQTMASVEWSVAKEFQPAILHLCESQFGPDCKVVHEGTYAEGRRWENIFSWAYLTTASEKSFSLAIGHHATLKIYERELKKSTRPKRRK